MKPIQENSSEIHCLASVKCMRNDCETLRETLSSIVKNNASLECYSFLDFYLKSIRIVGQKCNSRVKILNNILRSGGNDKKHSFC